MREKKLREYARYELEAFLKKIDSYAEKEKKDGTESDQAA